MGSGILAPLIKPAARRCDVNIIFLICMLFLILLQGCNQGHSSSMKVDAFTNYANSNEQQQEKETTNQQSNAIVNVAF
jgi:hypothetical protein